MMFKVSENDHESHIPLFWNRIWEGSSFFGQTFCHNYLNFKQIFHDTIYWTHDVYCQSDLYLKVLLCFQFFDLFLFRKNKTKRVTRVEMNKRARRKERLRAEAEAKKMENISKEIDRQLFCSEIVNLHMMFFFSKSAHIYYYFMQLAKYN